MSTACGLCDGKAGEAYLCGHDTLALAARLDRIPKVYAALAGFLAPAGASPGEHVSVSRVEPGLPVNEDVLDLRYGGMALVLESWRSDVQRARGWGEPAIEGSIDRRVLVAARALSMNLEWIAASYPAAGDLAREIRELEGAALSIVGALPDRGRRIGQCVAADASGVVCGAVLRHRAGETRIVCPWCTCVYEAGDFLMLKALQPEEVS